METYYHSDPKIEVWAKQITEKLLTASLLSGADSDFEYQKGCQLVAKLTALLQRPSEIPAEYLADGIKQIIEQQLPDSRVTSNISMFQDIMTRMIYEGMVRAIGAAEIKPEEIEAFQSQPALAVVYQGKGMDKPVNPVNLVNLRNSGNLGNLDNPVNSANDPIAESDEQEQVSEVQLQKERLKKLLIYLFPKETIQWDLRLHEETFLAQVKDILIYCGNLDQAFKEEIYTKDGWKIMMVGEEELAFPRRLQRNIKNLLRSGKKLSE